MELEKAYEKSKTTKFKMEQWDSEEWREIKKPELYGNMKDTGIDTDILKDLGKRISTLP